MTQPPPKAGRENVTAALIRHLEERARIGKERYGTPLQTHNGRDALQDLLEEQLDAIQYTFQAIMERDDMAVELARLRSGVGPSAPVEREPETKPKCADCRIDDAGCDWFDAHKRQDLCCLCDSKLANPYEWIQKVRG